MADGLARLRGRIDEIPERLRRFDLDALALPAAADGARALIATGAGSSLENARLLAALVAEHGLAARCAAPGALLGAPPARAGETLLVVFSQGLSPNGRAALRHLDAYRSVVLVTGDDPPADAERAAALEQV